MTVPNLECLRLRIGGFTYLCDCATSGVKEDFLMWLSNFECLQLG